MLLTTAQLMTLKTDILADPVLSLLPNNDDGNQAIADAYNLNASPDYWVWRTLLTKNELTQATSVDETTFNWTGTGFIGRSQGERDAWRELFSVAGSVNPSLANVRNAFVDIFSGPTPPAPANRTHLSTSGRRKCRRIEKLFSILTVGGPVQTGLRGNTTNPDTLVLEGTITRANVLDARNQP